MEKQWFTPPGQDAVQLQLRPLSRAEMWDLSDHITNVNGIVMPNAVGRKMLARVGIVDWQGVTGKDGQAVGFPAGNLAAMLDHLPFHLLDAAAVEVFNITSLAEADRKNC
ncbi:hypothetical protein KUW19_00220 [Ferrimonas balearica]|uniref:hypothetical protein n=1 Tax=Ferrimonas balearica TaxID=44012 RepID=UPI001C98AC32|nr:hypothetical protein [Ferrimonas balearica]MBY6104906.1 hypothetical protein [Ferrimonas balearica]